MTDRRGFLCGFQTLTVGGRHGKATRTSRKASLTSRVVSVQDSTTGFKAEATISEGHYSKKEMQRLTEAAFDALIEQLVKRRKTKR